MVMETTRTQLAFVVRDTAGRVVVAFWGPAEQAEAEAQEWAARRGYAVDAVNVDELV